MQTGLAAMAKGLPIVAAYTINGEQPVICTVIGDEPLRCLDE